MFSRIRLSQTIRFIIPILQQRNILASNTLRCQQSVSRHKGRSLSTVIAQLSEQAKPEYKGTSFLEVAVNNKENCIEVTWDIDEEISKYPFIWLRDNCQCEKCFDPSAQSRTLLIDDLDLKIRPISVNANSGQLNLQINWSEGHQSTFSADWLKERSFSKKVQQNRTEFSRLQRIYWGCESFQDIPRIRFVDILETDKALLAWLQGLERYGFVFITGAPAHHGLVRKLAERVAFVRRTHYGEEFSVKVKSDPSNVAYSSGPLQIHADLPYYKYKPGTQLIHCIEQFNGKGGESLVADAANVAYHFKKEKRPLFDLLSNICVDWCDVGQENGKEFYKMLQQPIICLDGKGEIERINFSQPQRDSFFNTSFDQVEKWYSAYKEFFDALNSPQYCLKFKMAPGTIQSFDNLRIVHGRTGYDSTMGNREIEGCYIDWDEVKSTRRVLQFKNK